MRRMTECLLVEWTLIGNWQWAATVHGHTRFDNFQRCWYTSTWFHCIDFLSCGSVWDFRWNFPSNFINVHHIQAITRHGSCVFKASRQHFRRWSWPLVFRCAWHRINSIGAAIQPRMLVVMRCKRTVKDKASTKRWRFVIVIIVSGQIMQAHRLYRAQWHRQWQL